MKSCKETLKSLQDSLLKKNKVIESIKDNKEHQEEEMKHVNKEIKQLDDKLKRSLKEIARKVIFFILLEYNDYSQDQLIQDLKVKLETTNTYDKQDDEKRKLIEDKYKTLKYVINQ